MEPFWLHFFSQCVHRKTQSEAATFDLKHPPLQIKDNQAAVFVKFWGNSFLYSECGEGLKLVISADGTKTCEECDEDYYKDGFGDTCTKCPPTMTTDGKKGSKNCGKDACFGPLLHCLNFS